MSVSSVGQMKGRVPVGIARTRTLRARALRVFGVPGLTGIAFLAILAALSIAAPWVSPYSPTSQDPFLRNAPPTFQHWLGTDGLGRDTLTRLLFGARASLGIAMAATMLGAFLGVVLGIVGGYVGGRVGAALAWVIDMLMSFPALIIGIMVVAALGPGLTSTIAAIGVALVARFARLARASTLSIRRREYVLAAIAVGARPHRIMFRYVAPNISGPIFGIGVVWLAHAIVTEASLSFLGLGVQPPEASWGSMIKDAMRSMTTAPWVALAPGAAITLAATAITVVGDRLQSTLDPRLRPRG